MKEKGPRKTYVLTRGEYDHPDPDQLVEPGVADVLPMLPDGKISTWGSERRGATT